MLNQFETRHNAYLNSISELIADKGLDFLRKREWDMKSDTCVLRLLKILHVTVLLAEWQAMEQNTFYPKYDLNGCQQFVYPSEMPIAEVFGHCEYKTKDNCCDPCNKVVESGGGFIGAFNCLHIDIKPALRAMGVYPYGFRPNGIAYMVISDNSTSVCFPPNPFQVNKQ
jgi:hypothetical protein